MRSTIIIILISLLMFNALACVSKSVLFQGTIEQEQHHLFPHTARTVNVLKLDPVSAHLAGVDRAALATDQGTIWTDPSIHPGDSVLVSGKLANGVLHDEQGNALYGTTPPDPLSKTEKFHYLQIQSVKKID